MGRSVAASSSSSTTSSAASSSYPSSGFSRYAGFIIIYISLLIFMGTHCKYINILYAVCSTGPGSVVGRRVCVSDRVVLNQSGLSDLSLYLRDCSPFSGSVRNTTTWKNLQKILKKFNISSFTWGKKDAYIAWYLKNVLYDHLGPIVAFDKLGWAKTLERDIFNPNYYEHAFQPYAYSLRPISKGAPNAPPPITQTNQNEQHSVSSIWNQSCFSLYSIIIYFTDLFFLYFFIQNTYADEMFKEKMQKKELCLMGQIVIENHSFLEYWQNR